MRGQLREDLVLSMHGYEGREREKLGSWPALWARSHRGKDLVSPAACSETPGQQLASG